MPATKVAQEQYPHDTPSQTTDAETLSSWETTKPPLESPTSVNAPTQSWGQPLFNQDVREPTAPDLDLALIWPDSEDLFQSIISADTTDQWQMSLGTLPFPSVAQDIHSFNLGSPNSFDNRCSSIGAIPSGGSHQAVRDVTEMVHSSVSLITGPLSQPPPVTLDSPRV